MLKGLLRTSWLNGTLNEFLDSESAISGLEEIIFDSEVVEGEVEIELSGKRIVAIHDIPSSIDVSGSLVYTPSSDDLKLDKLSFHDTAFSIEHGVNLLKIQDGNSTIAMFNGNSARFFANILGNALLTHFSSSQGIAKFSISGDPWDNILALFMDRAKIDTLRVSDIRGESLNEEHIAPVVGPNFPNGFQSSIQMLMDGHVRKGDNSRIDSFPIAGNMRHIVKDDDDYLRMMISLNNFKELLHFDDTYSGNLGERVLLIDALVSTEHKEFTLYYSCVAQAGRYLHVKLLDGTTETTIAKIGQNSRVTFVYEGGAWNADFFRI